MVTKCIAVELRNLGDDYSGAAVYAKGLVGEFMSYEKERLPCPHDITSPVDGFTCIKEVISAEDRHPSIVAALGQKDHRMVLSLPNPRKLKRSLAYHSLGLDMVC